MLIMQQQIESRTKHKLIFLSMKITFFISRKIIKNIEKIAAKVKKETKKNI